MESAAAVSRRDQQASLIFLLLYHNLGGEMIYILNQRLAAQKVHKDKANQVLVDVITNFVNSKHYWLRTFVCCSGRVLDHLALKIPFESIISSSPIMKLTASSYDKLYDLMVGVFKYQVCQSPYPSSLYYVTLNHINAVLDLASEIGQGIRNVVRSMQESFVEKFSLLSRHQWFTLRDIILSNYMIDIRTRISILCREKKQDIETGLFVIETPQVPPGKFNGTITHYDEKGDVISTIGIPCLSISEMTTLGLDIYRSTSDVEEKAADEASEEDKLFQVNGGKEVNLLANLLGAARSRQASSIALKFQFHDDKDNSDEEEDIDESGKWKYQKFETKDQTQPLSCTLIRAGDRDLDLGKSKDDDDDDDDDDYNAVATDGDELLALMDS